MITCGADLEIHKFRHLVHHVELAGLQQMPRPTARAPSRRVSLCLAVLEGEIDALVASADVQFAIKEWGLSTRPRRNRDAVTAQQRRRARHHREKAARLNAQLNPRPTDIVLRPRFSALLDLFAHGDPANITPGLGLSPPRLLTAAIADAISSSPSAIGPGLSLSSQASSTSSTLDSAESLARTHRRRSRLRRRSIAEASKEPSTWTEDQSHHDAMILAAERQQEQLKEGISKLQAAIEECLVATGRTQLNQNMATMTMLNYKQERLRSRSVKLLEDVPQPSQQTTLLWLLPIMGLEQLLKSMGSEVTRRRKAYAVELAAQTAAANAQTTQPASNTSHHRRHHRYRPATAPAMRDDLLGTSKISKERRARIRQEQLKASHQDRQGLEVMQGTLGFASKAREARKTAPLLLREAARECRGLTVGAQVKGFGRGLYSLDEDDDGDGHGVINAIQEECVREKRRGCGDHRRRSYMEKMKRLVRAAEYAARGGSCSTHEEDRDNDKLSGDARVGMYVRKRRGNVAAGRHGSLSLQGRSTNTWFELSEDVLRRFEFDLLQEDRTISQVVSCIWARTMHVCELAGTDPFLPSSIADAIASMRAIVAPLPSTFVAPPGKTPSANGPAPAPAPQRRGRRGRRRSGIGRQYAEMEELLMQRAREAAELENARQKHRAAERAAHATWENELLTAWRMCTSSRVFREHQLQESSKATNKASGSKSSSKGAAAKSATPQGSRGCTGGQKDSTSGLLPSSLARQKPWPRSRPKTAGPARALDASRLIFPGYTDVPEVEADREEYVSSETIKLKLQAKARCTRPSSATTRNTRRSRGVNEIPEHGTSKLTRKRPQTAGPSRSRSHRTAQGSPCGPESASSTVAEKPPWRPVSTRKMLSVGELGGLLLSSSRPQTAGPTKKNSKVLLPLKRRPSSAALDGRFKGSIADRDVQVAGFSVGGPQFQPKFADELSATRKHLKMPTPKQQTSRRLSITKDMF